MPRLATPSISQRMKQARRTAETDEALASSAGSASVAAAIEFAKLHRGDCTNLVTYEALRETGMLHAYLKPSK